MFIQVITGTVTDADGLRRQSDRWQDEVRPGATGYLGVTAGVTDDGRFIALARFDSEASARANSERVEQGNWWAETEKCLDNVSFLDSTDIVTLLGGGSNAAGFIQVMRGRVTDPAKLAALGGRLGEFEAAFRRVRPDILGEVMAIHPDGTYTDAVYFRSEAEARNAEGQEPPPDMQALFGEYMAAVAVDEYLDLKDPWLH
jgi:hypothetical protein